METAPCYIVSESLAQGIERANFTGVTFDEVEVTTSDQFRDIYPNRQLPHFVWLKVDGTPGSDDFGIAPGLQLVVSERALNFLGENGVSHAEIAPFQMPKSCS